MYVYNRFKVQGLFICIFVYTKIRLFIRIILNYTGYNQKWNVNQVRSAQWTVQNFFFFIKVTQHKSIHINIGKKNNNTKNNKDK